MERNKELARRLSEVLLDGYWIANTNYKSQIESVTWEQAVCKIGSLNSIAALTFHVDYYLAGLVVVFQGGPLEIRDKYSFDISPIECRADWEKLVGKFLADSKTFIEEVARLPDGKLNEPFVDEKYGTYLRNIEGVIEHAYYHLGQISLIKKIILEQENDGIKS